MPGGGSKKGERRGGRKVGSVNKSTIARKAETAKILASGMTPLEYMLAIMRRKIPKEASISQQLSMEMMSLDAAKAAAPYAHPKMGTAEIDPQKLASAGRRLRAEADEMDRMTDGGGKK